MLIDRQQFKRITWSSKGRTLDFESSNTRSNRVRVAINEGAYKYPGWPVFVVNEDIIYLAIKILGEYRRAFYLRGQCRKNWLARRDIQIGVETH